MRISRIYSDLEEIYTRFVFFMIFGGFVPPDFYSFKITSLSLG